MAEPVTATRAPAASQWVCPMHPEIVRDQPGACPICGMALEAVAHTLGIDDVIAEVLPDQKVDVISSVSVVGNALRLRRTNV